MDIYLVRYPSKILKSLMTQKGARRSKTFLQRLFGLKFLGLSQLFLFSRVATLSMNTSEECDCGQIIRQG